MTLVFSSTYSFKLGCILYSLNKEMEVKRG